MSRRPTIFCAAVPQMFVPLTSRWWSWQLSATRKVFAPPPMSECHDRRKERHGRRWWSWLVPFLRHDQGVSATDINFKMVWFRIHDRRNTSLSHGLRIPGLYLVIIKNVLAVLGLLCARMICFLCGVRRSHAVPIASHVASGRSHAGLGGLAQSFLF